MSGEFQYAAHRSASLAAHSIVSFPQSRLSQKTVTERDSRKGDPELGMKPSAARTQSLRRAFRAIRSGNR
jgi:hypothetical protein